VSNGELALFAEVSPQYQNMMAGDPSLEPYFALAEDMDVPVGIHLGEGPVGGAYWATPAYRARLSSPLQLEDILIRHPRLRVYVMHYGSPLVDEMIALLFAHPQVYVDIAGNDWTQPRPHFYTQLRRLIEAGFIKRIMWGSDQMVWPSAIDIAIDTIEQATSLSDDQKRDIFYNNAARFLRFTPEDVAMHHRR
jgi:predicted TIM-barrel fold metal-dependent hydrolase